MTPTIRHTGNGFSSAGTGYVGANETVEVEDETAEHYVENHSFEYADGDGDSEGEGDAAEEYDPAVTADDVSVEGEMVESAQAADSEDDFATLSGVGEATAESLRGAGFESFDDLGSASVEEIAEVNGVSDTLAASLREQVQEPDTDADEESEE